VSDSAGAGYAEGKIRNSGARYQAGLYSSGRAMSAQARPDATLHDASGGVPSAMHFQVPSAAEEGYLRGKILHPLAFAVSAACATQLNVPV
jgi:hypothetical protein